MEESTKAYIESLVTEELEKLLAKRFSLYEGMNIDKRKLIVSFDPFHQNNVDTNDYIHPYIIQNNVRGETVLSIFERKDNDKNYDGNPVVYALKGLKGWSFNNPSYDIMALMRRFVAVTTQLHQHFDTLITIPSSNQLNQTLFSYLIRLVNFENQFNTFFRKLTVDEVVEYHYNPKFFERLSKNPNKVEFMREQMDYMFTDMRRNNRGIFSYKYIKPLKFRDAIEQSMALNFDNDITMQYRNYINGKNVLVLDDTVASGKTLSDSANVLRETFDPSTITFLTVFSPKTSQGFENTREYL